MMGCRSRSRFSLEGGIWLPKVATYFRQGLREGLREVITAMTLGWIVFRLTANMIDERHLKPIMQLCG